MDLVTGANGFLGAHLCASLLERGHSVRACKREQSKLDEFTAIVDWRLAGKKELLDHLEWVHADINDYDALLDALEGIDTVYHCAAVVSFWPRRRAEMFKVNVEGTANVVNACLASGTNRLCHVSSIAALGRTGKEKSITEEAQWQDSGLNSNYAITKYLAEQEVWRGQMEGLSTVIVNPGVILGEGDWNKGSCRFFKMVINGMTFYTHGQNGYVDVIDVANGMVNLVEKGIESERFILIAENIPVKDFLGQVAQQAGVKAPQNSIPIWILQIAWRILHLKSLIDGKEPLITKETCRTVSKPYFYDNAKIKSHLPEVFRPVEATIERVLDRLK